MNEGYKILGGISTGIFENQNTIANSYFLQAIKNKFDQSSAEY
jgi:hypothetical protein